MATDEKFRKLAINRVNRSIKLLRLVGNLANRSHYKFSTIDAKKITDALTREVQAIKSKFQTPSGGRQKEDFTLD